MNPTALLGKNVIITLDENVIVEGKLLAWNDGGEAAVECEDGFVTHCWPMLDIKEAT